ncbi:unnamed protein product, partial [Chrysoparadoxa australica]
MTPFCLDLLAGGEAGPAIQEKLGWSRDDLLDDEKILGLFAVLQLISIRAIEIDLKTSLSLPILCFGRAACVGLLGASYLQDTVTPGTSVKLREWGGRLPKGVNSWYGIHAMHPASWLYAASAAKDLDVALKEQGKREHDDLSLKLQLRQIHLARLQHDAALIGCCQRAYEPKEGRGVRDARRRLPVYADELSKVDTGAITVPPLRWKQLRQLWFNTAGFDPGWWEREAALLQDAIRWVAGNRELRDRLPEMLTEWTVVKSRRSKKRRKRKNVKSQKRKEFPPDDLTGEEALLLAPNLRMEGMLRVLARSVHQVAKRLKNLPFYDGKSVALGVMRKPGGQGTPKVLQLEVGLSSLGPRELLLGPAGARHAIPLKAANAKARRQRVNLAWDGSEYIRRLSTAVWSYGQLLQELPHQAAGSDEGRHPLEGLKMTRRTWPKKEAPHLGIMAGMIKVQQHGEWKRVKAYRLFAMKTSGRGPLLERTPSITLMGEKPVYGDSALPALAAELIDWKVAVDPAQKLTKGQEERLVQKLRDSWYIKSLQQRKPCHWLTSWKLHLLHAPSRSLVLKLGHTRIKGKGKAPQKQKAVYFADDAGSAQGSHCTALTNDGSRPSVVHYEPFVPRSRGDRQPPDPISGYKHDAAYWAACEDWAKAARRTLHREAHHQSKPGKAKGKAKGDATAPSTDKAAQPPLKGKSGDKDGPSVFKEVTDLIIDEYGYDVKLKDIAKSTLQAHDISFSDPLMEDAIKRLLEVHGRWTREQRRLGRNANAGLASIILLALERVFIIHQGRGDHLHDVQEGLDTLLRLAEQVLPSPYSTEDDEQKEVEKEVVEDEEEHEEGEQDKEGDEGMLETARSAASQPLHGIEDDVKLMILCGEGKSFTAHLRLVEGLVKLLTPGGQAVDAFMIKMQAARERSIEGNKHVRMERLKTVLHSAWELIKGSPGSRTEEGYLTHAAGVTCKLPHADEAKALKTPFMKGEDKARRYMEVQLGGPEKEGEDSELKKLHWKVWEDDAENMKFIQEGYVSPPAVGEEGKRKLWREAQRFFEPTKHLSGIPNIPHAHCFDELPKMTCRAIPRGRPLELDSNKKIADAVAKRVETLALAWL